MSVYRELFVEVKPDPQSFAARMAARIDALDRMFRLYYGPPRGEKR